MVSVCFYFQVHQPNRARKYRIFDIGKNHDYFDARGNKEILERVAQKCYLPTNRLMLDLFKRHPEFKVSFSFSGVVLEQFEALHPEVLDSFKALVKSGHVELISETYYHSLAFLFSKPEFVAQVKQHQNKIKRLFGQTPSVFRNTELIYNNELAEMIGDLGYRGILAEGADKILGWRSPNFIYSSPGKNKVKLLLKNYRLSDDIAFRFSNHDWGEFPLTAPKFARWVNKANGNGNVVNLFMDYETFGEHQWPETGIFEFLEHLPEEILKFEDNDFVTPSEAIARYKPLGVFNSPEIISWADVERDASAWVGNDIQKAAAEYIYEIRNEVLKTKDAGIIEDWRKLQTSDHFYYMCTKWFNDGDVHKYFNPYDTPYDAFINFMNILNDLLLRIEAISKKPLKGKKIEEFRLKFKREANG